MNYSSDKLPEFKDNPEKQIDSNDTESLTERQAFAMAQKAFQDLEAKGASDFTIFNGLAELFHQRNQSKVSGFLAEAAYECYQQTDSLN